MRSSAVLAAFLAMGAMAAPVKRAMVEDIIVITVTDYVYVDGPAPTSAPVAEVNSVSWLPVSSSTTTTSSTTITSTTPVYTPPVAVPTSTSTTPAYNPPPPPAYTPPPPPPVTSTAVAAAAAVVTSAPASNVEVATPAAGSWNAPTTVNSNLDVTSPTYAAIAVAHHNIHRANHTADPLAYNTTIAAWAQAKANSCVWNEDMYVVSACDDSLPLTLLRPAGASGVGMNIAQGTLLYPGNLGSVISDMWYNGEVTLYPGYTNPNLDVSTPAFQDWGHFSQVVWKGTTQVGCGSAACGAGTSIGSGYFVACLYGPPGELLHSLLDKFPHPDMSTGNYVGDFSQVGKPLGNPTVAVVKGVVVGV